MNLKFFAVAAGILTLAACDNGADSAALKGRNFYVVENGTPVTITFDETENRVGGRIVNIYNGTYEIDGNHIKFGPMATTMMMGPAEAMQTEREYLQFLDTVETYKLKKDQLTLKGADGREVVFVETEITEEGTPANFQDARPVITLDQIQ